MPHEKSGRNWEEIARSSVARALAEAEQLAETQLAAAMLATEAAEYGKAAVALTRALSIAPTYVEALSYLGGLLCEAGRLEAGVARLELAAQLDPTQLSATQGLARVRALQGDDARYEQALERLRRAGHGSHMAYLQLELRVAHWRGDRERMLDVRRRMEADGHASGHLSRLYAALLLGEEVPEVAEAQLRKNVLAFNNRRFAALICQQATEAFCGRQRPDLALGLLELADERKLLDILWLDHCPILAPLRDQAAFSRVRKATQQRATPFEDIKQRL